MSCGDLGSFELLTPLASMHIQPRAPKSRPLSSTDGAVAPVWGFTFVREHSRQHVDIAFAVSS